ncbi:hypothetical protein GWK48_10870 [Metallosphaera tengchongensis]|uniref:Uncharacterized protein n=1 Tax=Metallosphaera tengchongensis TaxID=1532350 RepID=A0A6N0NZ51_9CREN|nr:hypothetical protein [Metallosphaera tengchongensis]QKR00819.1 hypothetical protein GWK48_10870 [Metallosphaera tengchongensis]
MAKVNFLSGTDYAHLSRILKELSRHKLRLQGTSEIGEHTIVVMDGSLDIKITLALIAIVYTKCERIINIIKSAIKGIDNWQNVIRGLQEGVGKRSLKNVMFIGDIDNQDKYQRLRSSLEHYNVTEIKRDEVFYLNFELETRIIITFNGNKGNSQFTQHEIEEDVFDFLRDKQIMNSLGKLGLQLQNLSNDPKEAYGSIKKQYENLSSKDACNRKKIEDFDMLAIHYMLTNKDITEKVFNKQIAALKVLLGD